MRRRMAVLAAILLACVTTFGQSDRGTISGRVTDNTGAAVPGAKVVVSNLATGAGSTLRRRRRLVHRSGAARGHL
jgi:hypothetical protein